MSTEVTVPAMGESINDAVILRWIKTAGDHVTADEPICELETDKATFDLPAPVSGALQTLKEVGATVQVGEVVAQIVEVAAENQKPIAEATPPRAPRPEPAAEVKVQRLPEPASEIAPAAARTAPAPLRPTRPTASQSARSTQPEKAAEPKEVAEAEPAPRTRKPAVAAKSAATKPEPARAAKSKPDQAAGAESNGSRRVPMSKIRRRIAERLVRAQQTAAMLTTFNEIDMTAVLDLRERHKEQFEKSHGVSLGLMSFFSRACVLALRHHPALNAEIEGDDILYHDHVHLGIAVNTERGLVVPVLRHVETMSFAKVEEEIKRVAGAARDGKLALQELSGGTFTITNGGVFGSLLSTPILNPPQTGILGMHTIQKRPVVIGDDIKARRMMYVALSYDHRLVDGRDAVMFLVQLKKSLEDPMSMLLEG